MSTQSIIPISAAIDEDAEFRKFERATDARLLCETLSVEELLRARNRQKRAQREQRRKLVHNCKLMLLGAASCACVAFAIMAWQTTPVFSLFPAALSLLSIWRGLCD